MTRVITIQETGRGIAYNADGTVFHSTDGMPGLGGEPLRSTLTNLSERDAPLHREMLPDAIPAKRRQLFASSAMPVFGAAINEARRFKSDAIAADARQREPVMTVDPVIAVETRATARTLDASAQAKWVEAADLAGLTVVGASGNPANLIETIFERAQERYWVENWIARHNAEGGHPAEPTVEMVLATGPNMNAVRAEAEHYRKANIDRLSEIDQMEAAAQSLVHFISVLFDMAPQEALDMAMGRDRAKA